MIGWLYAATLIGVAIFGAHMALLLGIAVFAWRRQLQTRAATSSESWPHVLIQIPIFNERCVVDRAITAAASLDYPRDRLRIQVLDDSTDDTPQRARASVARLAANGLSITHVHRRDRSGFKAGALALGLAQVPEAEFVAIFDADFVPRPDFLKRLLPEFTDQPRLGLVQARWEHLNHDATLLTRAQALMFDGYFSVDQVARSAAGLLMNFNGAAGLWRRSCVDESGGWQAETLTEDLDLSYRAQLSGWRFRFLEDLHVPAEIPVQLSAYKRQQFRWAKGSIQTAKKLLPMVLSAKVPFQVKLEGFFHLTNNLAYPLMVALAVMMPLSMVVRFNHGAYSTMFLDMPVFTAATASITLFYFVTMRELGYRWLGILVYLPFVMSLGIGMAVNQCKAVAEALLDRQSDFARTPKTGSEGKSIKSVKKTYLGRKKALVPLIELAFAVYYAAALYYAWDLGIWSTIPFLLLFLVGFSYVGATSLVDLGLRARLAAALRSTMAQPVA